MDLFKVHEQVIGEFVGQQLAEGLLTEECARIARRETGLPDTGPAPIALHQREVSCTRKFLKFGCPAGGEPVTFARYTGRLSGSEVTPEPVIGETLVRSMRTVTRFHAADMVDGEPGAEHVLGSFS